MHAMVLAAGAGRRLGKFCKGSSKVLVPVAGKPLLGWNLLLLKKAGIRSVMINLHAGASDVCEYVRREKGFGLNIFFSYEPELLGTAGAVKKAESFFKRDDFVVVYGDNLTDFDLKKMIRFHQRHRGLCTLGLFDPQKTAHSGILAGLVRKKTSGRITAFLEKRGNRATQCGDWVSAGVFVLAPRVLKSIPENRSVDFGRNVFPRLLRAGDKILGWAGARFVLASDTPETLKATRTLANQFLKG